MVCLATTPVADRLNVVRVCVLASADICDGSSQVVDRRSRRPRRPVMDRQAGYRTLEPQMAARGLGMHRANLHARTAGVKATALSLQLKHGAC